jgi:2-succinyl-6-hydroxy-2,4-cyclohexadiene-1-carboxylate synthase
MKQRIIALHGNVGAPEDWLAVEMALGLPLEKRCLWQPGALEFNDGDILLGYSLGGRLALQAAAANPSKFKAVIAVSAHPGLKTDEERQARAASDAAWAEAAIHLPWTEFLKVWDAQDVLGNSSADRSGLEVHRHAMAEAFATWSLGSQPDLREALKRVGCPLHWVTGKNDVKFTELAMQAGCGTSHIIPRAGHRVLFDQPEALATLIAEILS